MSCRVEHVIFYVPAGLHHHMWLHNFRQLLTAPFKTILCILLNKVQAIAGPIYESKLPFGKEVQ